MVTTAQSPISDVFRFVSVRGVNTPAPGAANRRFVLSDLPQTYPELDAMLPEGAPVQRPLLLVELPALRDQVEREALMVRMAAKFATTSPHLLTSAAIATAYPPGLQAVYFWHRDNNRNHDAKRADFVQQVESAINGTATTFTDANDFLPRKIRLWENLVAEYIAPSDQTGSFLSQLVDMIRWFWILERLGRHELNDGQDIYEAMHATVVLPDDLLHISVERDPAKDAQTAEHASDAKQKIDQKRITDIDRASKELTLALRNLAAAERHTVRPVAANVRAPAPKAPPALANSGFLPTTGVEALDGNTQALLRELGLLTQQGVNVSYALERLDTEMTAARERSPVSILTAAMVTINGSRFRFDNLCHNFTPPDPCAPYGGEPLPSRCGLIRPPGIADLKVIRSVLLKYTLGELAHVENVLAGETKAREFNTMNRTEDTLVTEEESTTEMEKETQSTDRFEIEKEISTISKEEMKLDTGVKVTATLGPVSIDTHFNFNYNTSKEDSNKTATKNSQELMNRALSKITERRKTQRTRTTIVQVDDKNKHEVANPGPDHLHGLYYWLDKYYLSKVVNYGKRLMFEFVVPEPAAFFLYAKTHKSDGDRQPPLPLHKLGILSFNDIDDGNYFQLAAFYGAQDVAPPPPLYKIVTTSLKQDKSPSAKDQDDADKQDLAFTVTDGNQSLRVPDGYLAHHADVAFVIDSTTQQVKTGQRHCSGGLPLVGWGETCVDVTEAVQSFHLLIGNRHLRPDAAWSPLLAVSLNTEDTVIPVAASGVSRHFVTNIEVVCHRTDRHYRAWKNATFNSLVTGFSQKQKEYEDWLKSQDVNASVLIEGTNPDLNRRVEKQELKKSCVEMMSGQRFESFDAMRSNVPSLHYPEFSITEAFSEGNYIQFFEQAFEWEQITYVFYPYFWGRKPRWIDTLKVADPDPIFQNFLQAGAARVLVPARPGFEYDVVTFFASGGHKIWGGKQAPIPGSSHWLPIIDELKEQEGQFTGGAQEGDPWIYKVPTTLVFLDDAKAKLLDNSGDYPNDVAAAMKPVPGQFT